MNTVGHCHNLLLGIRSVFRHVEYRIDTNRLLGYQRYFFKIHDIAGKYNRIFRWLYARESAKNIIRYNAPMAQLTSDHRQAVLGVTRNSYGLHKIWSGACVAQR